MVGRRLALVIGNNYPNSGKELKFAVADALKMKDILTDKGICGFKNENVTLLIDETSNEASTKLDELLTDAHQDDLIFIYFSGHGTKNPENNKLYLLFKNTNEKLLNSSAISFDFINDCLKSPSALKASIVIVLDCCYSGAAGIRDADLDVMEAVEKPSGPGTVILTSTGSTGSPKAKEEKKLGHGVFTYYLIEGLEKGYADQDHNGYISIDELYEYASNKTKDNSSQSPSKKGSVEGSIFIGIIPKIIKERKYKYELKKTTLIKILGPRLPPIILNESLIILKKYYAISSPLEQVDTTILNYLESLLQNDILPEKRSDAIQNYIEVVQHLKGISINVLQGKQKEEALIQQKEEKSLREREVMSLNEIKYNIPKSSKVFISYSHDSPQLKQCVLQLSNRLRSEGVDCNIDQYEVSPSEGWIHWMVNQIEEADYILIVCTETYEKRFKGKEEAGSGLGAKWEGAIVTQELYYSKANKKCIPIVFSPEDSEYIPSILKSATYYALNIEETDDETHDDYDYLYAHLTNQLFLTPGLGELRPLTPRQLLSPISAQNKETEIAKRNQKPMIGELRKVTTEHENFPVSKTFTSPYTGMEFILIPAGDFMMGSPKDEIGRYDDEGPAHEVTIKKSFYIGKYPVTQKQWKTVMGNNPSLFRNNEKPVESVSWKDAKKFIRKLNREETDKYCLPSKYRLPSAAEWEYACRAGAKTSFSFGNNESKLGDYAWYSDNSGNETQEVGKKKPNSWGLYDMHGNVREWVQDKWHDKYEDAAPHDGSAWEDKYGSLGSLGVVVGVTMRDAAVRRLAIGTILRIVMIPWAFAL